MLSLEFMYTKYKMFLISQTRQVCIYRKKLQCWPYLTLRIHITIP